VVSWVTFRSRSPDPLRDPGVAGRVVSPDDDARGVDLGDLPIVRGGDVADPKRPAFAEFVEMTFSAPTNRPAAPAGSRSATAEDWYSTSGASDTVAMHASGVNVESGTTAGLQPESTAKTETAASARIETPRAKRPAHAVRALPSGTRIVSQSPGSSPQSSPQDRRTPPKAAAGRCGELTAPHRRA
jgi:hypothetical protein